MNAALDFSLARLLTMMALALLPPAQAAGSKGNDAARQIETLNARIGLLESRVLQLESSCPSSAAASTGSRQVVTAGAPAAAVTGGANAPSPAPGGGALSAGAVREIWRGIREGLTADQVATTLGAPQRKMTISGKLLWYYSYPGVGSGSVMFGGDQRVIGSQEPPFHW